MGETQMTITISAQRYLDDAIVTAKRESADYTVMVSPVFAIDGQDYRVVLDGHHSLAAAKVDGVEPEFVEQDVSDNDTLALLERGEIEDFLAIHRIDSDYYDIATGEDI